MQSLGHIVHQDTNCDMQCLIHLLMMLCGILPQRSATTPVELLRHVASS